MPPKPQNVRQNTASGVNDLLARILRCPDCGGALGAGLLCAGCGRSFLPAEDGIISALPAGMERPTATKEQLETVINTAGPGTHGESVVLYEQAFHDEQAPHYDRMFVDPLPVRSYYRHLVRDQIYDYLREVPFVVDLCCGTGKSSLPLVERGLTVVGMDISREMLRIYRRKSNGKGNLILIQANASSPPLHRNSCIAVSMIGGLHHIPDRAGSLQSCCDALSRGGLLILHEPVKSTKGMLARLLENAYALADPVRVWSAIRRRMGLKSHSRSETVSAAVPEGTPYERPFTSADELMRAMPRQMRTLTFRAQGALSFREFAPCLQSSIGQPLAALIVRLDEWLSTHSPNSNGDALFGVFRKESS